jgi:MOSC domain-containing protein YiiM
MNTATGRVVSVHIGEHNTLEKLARDEIEVTLDGIVGDRHRGISRKNWQGDKQAEGSERRNERQWSAVSMEELVQISEDMNLAEPLLASTLGANLCLEGGPTLSQLPRGTLLSFSSGVVLMVEEYNPPCSDMGEKLAQLHRSRSGEPLAKSAFSSAAKFNRGLVGIVEVAGTIRVGDEVTITPEKLPKWLRP